MSFTLLTSAAATSQLRVIGTIEEHFRPAYDILVRPAGSFTELERREQLVQQNYLSGIFGGITFQQYREIRRIPGVEVAAPIANIGFMLPFREIPITINRFLSDDATQMYRLRLEWVANNGLSTYPDSPLYIYYTRRNAFRRIGNGLVGEVLPGGRTVTACRPFLESRDRGRLNESPFNLVADTGISCFSARTPGLQWPVSDQGPFRNGEVGKYAFVFFPMLLAAIDPEEEMRLVELERAVIDGRLLRASDRVRSERRGGTVTFRTVPILVGTRTYLDENLHVRVERLDIPRDPQLHRALASSENAFRFVSRLTGEPVGTIEVPAVDVYEDYLISLASPEPRLRITYDGYWSSSPVRYDVGGGGTIVPETVANPPAAFRSASYGSGWAPMQNRDVQFRHLTPHPGSTLLLTQTFAQPGVRVIGTFDPELLPGFSPLSEVPLETYYPPAVYPADAPSRRALGAGPLLPTQNLGDYVSQPPLMLTNLRGLRAFTDPTAFEGADRSAPISVIRVRVADVTGPDELSRERIRRVAELIHQRTGLAVDITAGSSPREMLVELPPGKFGRPALLVREGWVEKGVAIRFLSAVDRKSLVLFVLVLVVCAFFLANAAFASVRARRVEIGTLRCLGWGQGTIFRAVLGELALVGLVAGVAGTALAAALVGLLSLQMSPLRTLLVAPIAVALAVAAGALPAMRASRSTPLDAVRPAVVGRAPKGPVRGISTMAVVNLRRVRSRALLGAGGLFVAVGALTLLLSITLSFRGVLVGTLLGEAISIQVRGVDVASVALAVALGGLSVADVLFLNLRERAPELVTLRATGWEERHLSGLVAAEGLGIGILGAVPGAGAGVALAWLIGGVDAAVVAAGALGAAVGILVALAGSAIPALLIGRMTPPAVLAEE
ncbi:MAG TPA: ABC transporter permease [Actinomycetota bacterium]